MRLRVPTEVYEGKFASSASQLASLMNEATAAGKRTQVIPMAGRAWMLISHIERVERDVPDSELPPQFLVGAIPDEYKVEGVEYPTPPSQVANEGTDMAGLAEGYSEIL